MICNRWYLLSYKSLNLSKYQTERKFINHCCLAWYREKRDTQSTSYFMATSSRGKSAIDALGKQDPQQVTSEEWRKILSPLEYSVAREGGTERPFSGKFDKHFDSGLYVCRCCGVQLFKSDDKLKSSCGWPAFSKSVNNDLNIVRLKDISMGMERVEVRCKQCNAHLGHVFDDGPKETGERYCINSCCIDFEK